MKGSALLASLTLVAVGATPSYTVHPVLLQQSVTKKHGGGGVGIQHVLHPEEMKTLSAQELLQMVQFQVAGAMDAREGKATTTTADTEGGDGTTGVINAREGNSTNTTLDTLDGAATTTTTSTGSTSLPTSAPEGDTPLETIRTLVVEILLPEVDARFKAEQDRLDEAYWRLKDCNRIVTEKEQSAGVDKYRDEHEVCRASQALLDTKQKKACEALHDYADRMGEIPDENLHAPNRTIAWREWLLHANATFKEHAAAFTRLYDACAAATSTLNSKRRQCDSSQTAYESATCTTVDVRSSEIGRCQEMEAPAYNETIAHVTNASFHVAQDFTAFQRILCYAGATDAEAVQACHRLVVNGSAFTINYPGWPVMVHPSKMYPCGAAWVHEAYSHLPDNAPAASCQKCPGLPDANPSVSTFVRWGAMTCPTRASLVYSGFAAGAHHSHKGGGANMICLTDEPADAPDTHTGNHNHAMLYGAEYEAHYGNADANNKNNKNAGCTTCSYEGATYVTWGSAQCSPGHELLYSGNVMASHHGHWKSEWVCVDEQRETHTEGVTNRHQHLWYLAEYECGSLPCSPYTQNKEVACAVCGVPDMTSSVFTRWGHDGCGDGASLVYSGVAAGSHSGHIGGGYNSICLTKNITDPPLLSAGNNDHALLYGTEYEDTYVGNDVSQTDAACAVCAYEGTATYASWGQPACANGHQLLYSGNVMASHHGQYKNEWVCVDEARKAHEHSSSSSHDGQRWYLAEYECGSLPCPPYKQNAEVACAICGVPEDSGSVFTRWGHHECPAESSSLVYSGFAAGAHYGHNGGGANSICLNSQSADAPANHEGNHDRALLYGTEYEAGYVGRSVHNHNAACAVCAYGGKASYTTWGRPSCSDGHDTLYIGNVWGAYHSHPKSNWVCVDEARQSHDNSASDENGNLWYLAEYECGSLPCPPYQENKEAACAVCGISESNFLLHNRLPCETFGSAESCPPSACFWGNSTCRVRCDSFDSASTCPERCTWDGVMCDESCRTFPTAATCPVERCLWHVGNLTCKEILDYH